MTTLSPFIAPTEASLLPWPLPSPTAPAHSSAAPEGFLLALHQMVRRSQKALLNDAGWRDARESLGLLG